VFDKLFDTIVQFASLFKFWQVVDEYQKGIILRLGKFNRVMGPGLHFLVPFGVDRTIEVTTVTKTADLYPAFLTIKDGTTVSASVIIRYNIRDVKKALLEVDHVMDAIKDAVNGHVSRLVRMSTWDELSSAEFAENLPKECRKRAWRYGIEIEDVILNDLCRTRAIAILHNTSPTNHSVV
jgi:regulator of protease activity HflC (stomatin/prohibitin superfamily)